MYVTLSTDDQSGGALPSISRPCICARETQIRAGTYLFYEGDEVNWLYQVTAGVLRQTRLLENGRRQVIAFGYPGDVVGFPANGCHHTDCDALVDTRLQPYRKSVLENADGDVELHGELLQAALSEISAMQDHFMMLGRKSAGERVASFLTVLAGRVGRYEDNLCKVDLPMRRADIADFLGLTTETVSRTLTQMRKSEIIEIDNIHTIVVLNPAALTSLSQGNED
ncbi:helix-turn-helix domain-containing protein [Aliiroseovarius sp. PTFE2010]|uniref:helix-turn-helix domain-containing protein n=1 Tax=Aliiroseovarius sp. PTFE2010 TaxID=3417190 RepID=UPI003CF2BB13